jgi:hypothetical protein
MQLPHPRRPCLPLSSSSPASFSAKSPIPDVLRSSLTSGPYSMP